MPAPTPEATWHGEVRLVDDDRPLGVLTVDLVRHADGARQPWTGQVRGNDYLVWGANHRTVTLVFDDGSDAEVVVRSGGALIGRGDPPAVLA